MNERSLVLLFFIVVIFHVPGMAQPIPSISTGTVPDTLCASGGTFMVPYTALDQFDPGNIFTVELSDPLGDFSSPTIIGSISSTTSGIILAAIPMGTATGMGYRIRVSSSSPVIIGSDNGVDITIYAVPNAGLNTALTVCTSDASFLLTAGGTPGPGGFWHDPNGDPFSGLFDPAIDPAGCYTYVVEGGVCMNDSSVLCITISQALSAGQDYTGPLCNNNGVPIPLWSYLGADAASTGNWQSPNGAWSGIFIPTIDMLGCYTYSALSNAPCANDVAVVCVTGLVESVEVGADSSVTICIIEGQYDLDLGLGGTPETGGLWTDENGAVMPDGVITTSDFGIGQFNFNYTIQVDAPCDSTSSVTLDIVACLGLERNQAPGSMQLLSHGNGMFTLIGKDAIDQVRVLDMRGRVLFVENSFDQTIEIDLTRFATGIHMVEVTTKSMSRSVHRVITE